MNRQIVENILGVIKTSTDRCVIVKGLTKLRTDLVKDRDGVVLFREVGGVARMVSFLNKPHGGILEVVLSILANCCTDELCCKEALRCKVVSPLVTILKSLPNPVIQCRACRLLGNLAKRDFAFLLGSHYQAIALAICQIIEETSDVGTRAAAYRACRFLLESPKFLKYFLQAKAFPLMLQILTTVLKDNVKADEEQKPHNSATAITAKGLKSNAHREEYFDEVVRGLEGESSILFRRQLLRHCSLGPKSFAMPKEKATVELACQILGCLLVLSELEMPVNEWMSLDVNLCSFESIVFFATEGSSHRNVALKIISNFSKHKGAFYALSSAGAVAAACDLLVRGDMKSSLSDSEKRHCISIICSLSVDACNRSKIRHSSVLGKLITIVRDSYSETDTAMILYLLNNFQYDIESMELMLREGLLSVLINQLHRYLTSDDEYYRKRREETQRKAKKRNLPKEAEEPMRKIPKTHDELQLDYDSPSSSPRSYASPSSVCSSRSMSPIFGTVTKGNQDGGIGTDSETYSPVYSDDDGEDEDTNSSAQAPASDAANRTKDTQQPHEASSDKTFDIMELLEVATRPEVAEENILDKEDDDDTNEVTSDDPSIHVRRFGCMARSDIDIIGNLIFRVTLLLNKGNGSELVRADTIRTLIEAINTFGANNNFSSSLTNILLESQFFVQVVKQGVVHDLYQMTKNKELSKEAFAFLDALTSVGESYYGRAELARLIRCDDVDSQKRAIIAVAYIIKNKRLLCTFFHEDDIHMNLLEIILHDDGDAYSAKAVDALTALAKYSLGIAVPRVGDEDASKQYEKFDETEDLVHGDNDMRFVVHETAQDTIIGFSKRLLCEASEVFNSMLTSDFREGNEGEIHFSSYTVSGLKYFLNLVVRYSRQQGVNAPPPSKYHVLLEAFEMTRVYIIPKMEQHILQLLIEMLDASNCVKVLEWSIENYHSELTKMTINYYLCSSLVPDAKVELFRAAGRSRFSTEWLQLILGAMSDQCCLTMKSSA